MLQPNEEVSITLTATEWNVVLAQLSEGPFKIVSSLIGKIHQQAQAQQPQADGQPNGAQDASHVSN